MLKTDIVVIGAGATGLCAAVSAAENGAKVILFEKQRSVGGTANFFVGTFAAESPLQREIFVDYTRDQAFKRIMDYSHWLADPRIVRAVVDESGSTIAWLRDMGVDFLGATINMPDTICPRTYHIAKGYGAAVMKVLAMRAKELGVDIRVGTPVVEILKEGSRITGVIVEQDGKEIEVEAKAVVIGTGGYLNNKEWIKKYTGFNLGVDLFPVGNVDKMGDGIRMAWEVGAAEEGTSVLEMFSLGPTSPNMGQYNLLEHVSMQPDLWVNKKGLRFCDECITFGDAVIGNSNVKQLDGITFRLFDTATVERLITWGMDKNGGMDNPPGTKLPELIEAIPKAIETMPTEVFEADSIEELAEKIEVDPATLRATIEEYNTFCAKGHDDLFAKDPRYLRPYVGPKYYAIKARTIALGTKGGIKINGNMEVVDKNHDPIPGLFAGGFDAGGAYGDTYCMDGSSGLSSAFALNSGRIAGRNAAKLK